MASPHHHAHDQCCAECEAARAAAAQRQCPEYAKSKCVFCKACHCKVQHTRYADIQNAVGASAGAMAVALSLTPFDVVKVRQQTFRSGSSKAPRFASMVRSVVASDGARGLWRGLVPGLTMAIPSSVLYLGAYENLRDRIATQLPSEDAAHAYAPLLAGLSARMMAATVASPVELVRVTLQSAGAGAGGASGAGAAPVTMSSTFASIVRTEGVRGLFRGLGSTLWRDAPFSAVYWGCFEATKTRVRAALAEQRGGSASSSSSSSSGRGGTQAGATAGAATPSPPSPPPLPWPATMLSAAASGTVAAVLTNPFDVVKTRQQAMQGGGAAADGAPVTISGILRSTVQQEGVRGLYRGLGVRVAKIAPATALFMGTYEAVKQLDVAALVSQSAVEPA